MLRFGGNAMEIAVDNTIDAWKEALRCVKNHGKDFKDADGRSCRELLGVLITIKNPTRNVDKPIQIMRGYDAWVYPDKDELAAIMLHKHYAYGYDYSYGPRIFNHNGTHDQLHQFVFPLLEQNNESRKAGIGLYDVSLDSFCTNPHLPSLIYVHFKIVNHELHCTSIIRSCDLFMGLPANMYQLSLLQDYTAKHLRLNIGPLNLFCCSAHMFHEHFDRISSLLR
jgi:thymidylate synthase